jgi:hypothetical protein
MDYQSNMLFGTDCIHLAQIEADDIGYDSEVGELLSGTVSKRLGHADTLDEFIQRLPGANKEDIFLGKIIGYKSSVNNKEKLFIFCDEQNYKTLAARWLKTLMPNCSFETFKAVYNTYKHTQTYIRNELISTKQKGDVQSYWASTDEELQEMYALSGFSTNRPIRKNISIEFQIAKWLADGKGNMGGDLSKKISSIAQQRILQDMDSIKEDMERAIYDLDDVWPELGSIDYFNLSIADILAVKSDLAFLGGKPFTEYDKISSLNKDINLKKNIDVMQEYVANTHSSDKGSVCFNEFVANNSKVPNVNQIMERELNYKEVSLVPPYLGSLIQEGKVNGYLVSMIFMLHKSEDAADKAILDQIAGK